MDYIQITVSAKWQMTEQISEIIIAKLAAIGFESFEEADNALMAYIQEAKYIGSDVKELLEHTIPLNFPDVPLDWKVNKIKTQNWNAQWEKSFQEIRINDKVLIKADFHKSKNLPEYVINIHPKMAFGTGHHETTRLMVLHMLSLNLQDKNILDWGTGSGVLSILAEKMGARSVTALDMDAWSVKNAKENAGVNTCTRITVKAGKLDVVDSKPPFDIVLANINKNTLIEQAASVIKRLAIASEIIVSGFYVADLVDVRRVYENHGLKFEHSLQENNWCAARFTSGRTA